MSTAGQKSRKLASKVLVNLLAACPPQPTSAGGNEDEWESDDETGGTSVADPGGRDVRDVITETLVSYFPISDVAQIADDSIKPLLPFLLSALTGSNAAEVTPTAQRLLGVATSLPSDALARIAVAMAGALIRAYALVKALPAGRESLLLALTCLTERVPAVLKVFTPQLTSIYVRGMGDSEHSVRARAGTAMSSLLPLVSRIDGILSSYCTLLRSSAEAGRFDVLDSLRGM